MPGTEIYYYVVEWDAKSLPWSDFRGKVLGPTDPAEAPADSLRGQILAKWQESLIKDWAVDPQVTIAAGKQGSIFDQLEDLDSAQCLDKIKSLVALNDLQDDADSKTKNSAFVFIKP